MKKSVTLILGNEENFTKKNECISVTMAFAKDDEGPSHSSGKLPSNPSLAKHLEEHWNKYKNFITSNSRDYFEPGNMIISGSTLELREFEISNKLIEKEINQWLEESREFSELRNDLREKLSPQDEIRFIIITKNELLQKLPWHLWELFKNYPSVEPAITIKTEENNQNFFVNKPKKKVKILAILGNSKGINIDEDKKILYALYKADVKFLVEPSLKEINDVLWEEKWDILYFAGHSKSVDDTGNIYINEKDSLDIDYLSCALRQCVKNGLKIAIFNSCDGLGIARKLNDTKIPLLIVNKETVPDNVAQNFLKNFLVQYSNGKSLYESVRKSREKLKGLETQFPSASWLPVIFQNVDEIPPKWEDLCSENAVNPIIKIFAIFIIVIPFKIPFINFRHPITSKLTIPLNSCSSLKITSLSDNAEVDQVMKITGAISEKGDGLCSYYIHVKYGHGMTFSKPINVFSNKTWSVKGVRIGDSNDHNKNFTLQVTTGINCKPKKGEDITICDDEKPLDEISVLRINQDLKKTF